MKAILIDDERLALLHLKNMLEQVSLDVEVIGAFTDPVAAMHAVIKQKPDVVFADIYMPGIDGLEMERQLKSTVPDVEIVFVSGDGRFAMDALELRAFDYMRKPLEIRRLQITLDRLKRERSVAGSDSFNSEKDGE
ncbi:LytR/AlgR family response regulator transcription factor [Brevibacillus centrosporus]|uniref:LytR/AlgR family response regulator transcription factor n=1 Tax=Brevibacillus centrosporus TaxID=54910 RepID=UPI0011146205|nr:response regulator [Brevibacillus centrosporus]MED4911844.1 response regulator [Brevibacillus centrosporus]